jgi:hypothetical protein
MAQRLHQERSGLPPACRPAINGDVGGTGDEGALKTGCGDSAGDGSGLKALHAVESWPGQTSPPGLLTYWQPIGAGGASGKTGGP